MKIDELAENAKNPIRILDLCCCPGLKLCAIADTLYKEQKSGDIVGVDISETRMSVCKRILHKYQIQHVLTPSLSKMKETNDNGRQMSIKLYCNDGRNLSTTNCADLNLVFDSAVSHEDEASRMGKRKRMNKSSRAREAKRLKEAAVSVQNGNDQFSTLTLFDRVLVDAECSTDGSIIHTHKRMIGRCHDTPNTDKSPVKANRHETGGVDVPLGVFNTQQLVELHALQRKLAASGFELLRKGGIMVYSTCSLSDQQNGDIVRWLLYTYPDARVVPLNFFRGIQSAGSIDCSDVVRKGSVPGTIQFLPNRCDDAGSVDHNRLFGGGFYIAKILKGFE